RAGVHAYDGAGVADRRAPDRAVGGVRHHGVKAAHDARVFRGIGRLTGLDILVALAVTVRVEHERGPTLRRSGVAGLEEHFRVQPADDGTAAARPQRVVRVLGELKVMRRVAGVDKRVLLGLRIVDGELATGA